MINVDVYEFLDTVDSGQDIEYSYNGVRYWYQGYTQNGVRCMEVFRHDFCEEEGLYYRRCVDKGVSFSEIFVKEPLFEGKTFWEVEQDVAWI